MTKRERTRATGCERHPEVTSCPPCARCGAPQCCPKCCEEASAEVKEPTMTEFERAALGAARAFADTWKEGVGKAEFVRMLKDQILHTLTSHARPAAGFIREATGPDRKVLGTLPVTKDGVVVLPRDEQVILWNSDQWHNHGALRCRDDGRWGANFGTQWRFVEDCYSTRQASEEASTPAAAQAERGEG